MGFGGRPEDNHERDRRLERYEQQAEAAKARRESGNLSLLQRISDSLRRALHRA